MSGGLTSHADCSINQHMIWFMEMTASGLIKYLNPHNDIQQKYIFLVGYKLTLTIIRNKCQSDL